MSAAIVQMPEHPCSFCRKNEATQLCDFVVDYCWTTAKDKYGRMLGLQRETCDNQICKKCAVAVCGHELCPSCKKLYDYVRANHDRRMRRLMRNDDGHSTT